MLKVPGWLRAVSPAHQHGTSLLNGGDHEREEAAAEAAQHSRMAVTRHQRVAVILTSARVTTPLTKWVHRRNCGLVKWLRLPCWLEVPLALVLLDYSLYLWHVAFHKVPFLWRFHQVHHVDLDMDASTAIRFHFGEMAISTGLQAFQILTIGVSPLTFSIWNIWLTSEVIFHHSNVELPFALERWLCKVIVTPRMHGIHHSLVPEELNSNWSSGLTLWDRLHGTLRLGVPQNHLTLGVAAYPDASEVTYPKLLEMPFDEQRYPPWVRPDGTVPQRDESWIPTPTALVPEAAEDSPANSAATRRI